MQNRAVHWMENRGRRWRFIAAIPILPTLLVSGVIISGTCLVLGGSIKLPNQDDRGRGSGDGFMTMPQKIEWRVGGRVISGQVTLRLLEAHAEDDTLQANLRVVLVQDSRGQRRLSQSEKEPTSHTQDVRIHWQKGTSCPTLHLRIPAFALPLERETLLLPSSVIKVEETEAEVPQLLCSWTRQINAGRSRLGILRALNRILLPHAVVSLPAKRPSQVAIGNLDF